MDEILTTKKGISKPAVRERKGMALYIFFRKEGFYPLELVPCAGKTADQVAVDNALFNPGTIAVERIDCSGGHTVYGNKPRPSHNPSLHPDA